MTYTKPKDWKGTPLKGTWEVTIKIDGVRAFWTGDGWVSRNDKPLYNLPINPYPISSEGWEAYAHDRADTSKGRFKATIQAVRAKNKPERMLSSEHLFPLGPTLDARLMLPSITDPTVEVITMLLAKVVEMGHEGLVLRQGDKWIKVKPEETYDVRVIGAFEGEGKHKGRLGGLITSRGRVGTGFTDEERENIWAWYTTGHGGEYPGPLEGRIIEVGFMSLTADGKFRHPRFERFRDDKDETDDLPA
jgi:hypothetical protein